MIKNINDKKSFVQNTTFDVAWKTNVKFEKFLLQNLLLFM